MSHGDNVTKIPDNFKCLASSLTCKIAIFENNERKLYGLQFHPEVQHTINGSQIIRNFIFDICKMQPN
jgi:GMP synthase (glutamine-hydrolysing)